MGMTLIQPYIKAAEEAFLSDAQITPAEEQSVAGLSNSPEEAHCVVEALRDGIIDEKDDLSKLTEYDRTFMLRKGSMPLQNYLAQLSQSPVDTQRILASIDRLTTAQKSPENLKKMLNLLSTQSEKFPKATQEVIKAKIEALETDLMIKKHEDYQNRAKAQIVNPNSYAAFMSQLNPKQLVWKHYWAPWCQPCMHELRDVIHAAKIMRAKGVKIEFYVNNLTPENKALFKKFGGENLNLKEGRADNLPFNLFSYQGKGSHMTGPGTFSPNKFINLYSFGLTKK